MAKCGYCKDKIALAHNGFSGIENVKFCQTCWHKIYSIHNAMELLAREPDIIKFVIQIKYIDNFNN